MIFEQFLAPKIKNLPAEREDTKIYIKDIFKKYIKANYIPINPLVIEYYTAKNNYDFELFQNIADWIFFSLSLYPQYLLQYSNEKYFIALGQISYFKCYRILGNQWILFEEIADSFEEFTKYFNEVSIIDIGT